MIGSLMRPSRRLQKEENRSRIAGDDPLKNAETISASAFFNGSFNSLLLLFRELFGSFLDLGDRALFQTAHLRL